MGFKCGIVGLPNVGKSTLFNALTQANVSADNFQFCTIDPNTGIVAVPDTRLSRIAEIVQPQKIIPTSMEFVDIAGLISGASQGEGLGNQFLAHIRETDAVAHVVRCFEDEDIVHVGGEVDPINDVDVINTELALADLDTVEKAHNKAAKNAKGGDKEAAAHKALLEKLKPTLEQGHALRTLSLSDEEWQQVRQWHLLTSKPVLYLANVDEDGFDNNPYLERLRELAAQEGAEVLPVCAKLEAEIAQLEDEEKREFLQELGMEEPGLARFIRAGYGLLGLLTFFTAGPKEARAWTCTAGSTAPQAAGAIHSDFQRGFIRAEVVGYDDFIHYAGEQGAKDAGRWRLEGKEYVVQDGDVIHFRFNV